MKQIPIIINPAANSTKAAAQVARIRSLPGNPLICETKGPGDADRVAYELAGAGYDLVVAAGGDGTVNEVINGLSRYRLSQPTGAQHTALGILPVGTMNVFSYELKLPGRNLEACWEAIRRRQLVEIDLWQANENYFAQLAGVGLDAQIVRETTWEMKKKFGPISYALTAARVLTHEAPMIKVEIEGRPPLFGSVVLIGNGRHYGGPVPVFQNADHSDGLLDILVFRKCRLLEVLQLVNAMAFADFAACDDLDYVQASHFKVSADVEVPFELDGELGQFTPVEFKPAPFRLSVVAGDKRWQGQVLSQESRPLTSVPISDREPVLLNV